MCICMWPGLSPREFAVRLLRLLNIASVALFGLSIAMIAAMYPGIAFLAAILVLAKLRRRGSLTAYGTARWADSCDLGGMIE